MDKQLKRLRDARHEFEVALNQFAGMEIDIRVCNINPLGFQRNENTGPWEVVARVIIDSKRVVFEDDVI